ncbi:hypothetical protein Vretimale_1110 [Volvox reticuliferus]|nr:hypothetical protein Vretifemale_10405 [Volvox reticuliferus]GIL94996.1 hypothetical protein Vretimale_1110 [Volvox reticuliferus]
MCEFLLARGAAPPAAAASRSSMSAASPLPPPSPVTRHTRRVLHVQSISSWAPSCIGPYSQATSYRGLVYLAGVIPLDPPVMTLVPGDITAQVLRAMMSCEAVAVAQRTTVVGAALGLTVYLAAAVGGGGAVSASLTPGGGGGLGGGGVVERSGMNFSSGGGAELRALTRAAVEAILEHGLPGYAQSPYRQNNIGPPSAGNTVPSGGCGSSRYHRSSTCESGIATPRSSHSNWAGTAGHGRVSAPPSRRSMMLGADGLDEEEEEAERAAAAAAAATPGGPVVGLFGGRLTSGGQLFAVTPVLDPYLQPPEVRVSIRPSVLYVTVPSLPRGSLVEIQPVCLDVEALSVIRKLTGHDSFVKRRNSSHHDALHQSAHNHHQGNNNSNCNYNQNNHHSTTASGMPLAQPSAAHVHGPSGVAGAIHSSPTSGGSGTAAIGSITSWSELPPTPRASLESLTGRDGGGGGGGSFHNNSLHHPPSSGSSPMQWQVSADLLGMGQLTSPLPNHMLSATGFMSPEAGSLTGTPSGMPLALSRQRSSGVGLLAMAGNGNVGAGGCVGYVPAAFSLRAGSSSNLYQRCLSPSPQPLPTASSPQVPGVLPGLQAAAAAAVGPLQLPMLQTPPHPPLSAQNSSHQLLSPTLQHLLQMQSSPQMLLQPLQQATMDAPPLQQLQQLQIQQQQSLARCTPMGAVSRRRRVSSSNGGAGPSKEALEAAAAAGTAGRASYSGSASSHSGPLGHHRSSLDGNILSFEVSSGRGGPPVVVSPLPHSVPHSVNAASLADVPATLPATVAGAVASGGNGHTRTRPTAITVPQLSVGGTLIQRSPFESAVSTAASAAAAAGMALSSPDLTPDTAGTMLATGRASPLPCAAAGSAMAGPRPPPAHIPHALSIPSQSSGGSGSNSIPTPGHHAAAAGAGTPPVSELPAAPCGPVAAGGASARPAAAPAAGSNSSKSSSDVMVTTVCCYGQVLRSLFHLPPAVFAPGVTTAQLTRRFRRAAASVLAAHGMDMSCLIWVRLWYEKGAVEFTDDEYGTANSSTPQATMLATATAGTGVHHRAAGAAEAAISVGGISGGLGPRVLHALENDLDDDSGGGGGSGGSGHRGKGLRRASGSGDSSSGGGGAAHNGVAAAHALGSSTVSCASPRPSASHLHVAAAEAVEVSSGLAGGGSGSPRCHSGSPASGVVGSSAHYRRLSDLQPDTLALDNRQGQQIHHHHHHHHHHSQHHHHHHHHQQQGTKDGPTNVLGQGQPAPPPQQQHQHFHVSWVPVQRVATNASPQLAQCVAVLEMLAALPTP